MAGRIRTTKKLAQRINRDYFKNSFPIPSWRRTLTVVLVAAGLGWLGWSAIRGNEKPYNAGPITSSHALFSGRCADCHVQNGVFVKSVTDTACNSCHNGPVHKENQMFAPSCTECHIEHKGQQFLAATSDKACTRCHSNLQVKSGTMTVAAKIESFSEGHPEFTPLRPGQSDPANIKFNHVVHLKKELRGPAGKIVQLKCDDCHRSGGVVARAFPFGNTVDPKPTVNMPIAHSKMSSRALMEQIDYNQHCSGCHPLLFDRRITEPVPHNKKPEEVRAIMKQRLEAYISAHPNEIPWVEPPNAQLPTRPPEQPAKSAGEWVSRRMRDAEMLLWRKTCKECHNLQYPSAEATPEVPKVNFTTRWLKKGEFDHQSHQAIKCESCHEKAANSKLTSDILLPGVKSCTACHKPGAQETARASCYECHQYHDWKKEQYVEPKFTTNQLVTGSVATVQAASH